MESVAVSAAPRCQVISSFWGCHQRFFRSLCMAMKVPELVKMAKGALADNKCVVVGLQTTGEARLNDAVKSGEDLEEFAGMKECVRFLLKRFPTGGHVHEPAPTAGEWCPFTAALRRD